MELKKSVFCIAAMFFIASCSNKGGHDKGVSTEKEYHYEFDLVTNTAPWIGRDGAGVAVLNGGLFVIGGWGSTYSRVTGMSTGNDVQYTDDLVNWEELKSNNYRWGNSTPYTEDDWEGRHSMSHTVVFDNKIYIVGGDTNSGHYQQDIWSSSDGANWEKEFSNLEFLKRTGHLSYVRSGCLTILGGQTAMTEQDQYIEYEVSIKRDAAKTCDMETFTTFNIVADNEFFPAGFTQIGVVDDWAYIVAAGYYPTSVGTRKSSNRMYRTHDDVNWEYVGDAPIDLVQFANVIGFDGKIFVMNGGYVDKTNKERNETNQVSYYDPKAKKWAKLENVPWDVRHAASVVVFNDELIMMAGTVLDRPIENENGRDWVRNDVWKIIKVYD